MLQLFLLLFLFSSLDAYSQLEYSYEIFDIEVGMPSNTVYCLLQDQHGYIWMGTDKGVVRYDGEAFEIFTTQEGLTNNEIFRIQEGPNHDILVATFLGGICYLKNKQCYPHPQNAQILDILKNNWIQSWSIDPTGAILFSVINYKLKDSYDNYFYAVDTNKIERLDSLPGSIDLTLQNDIYISPQKEVLFVSPLNQPNVHRPTLGQLINAAALDDSTFIFTTRNAAFISSSRGKILDSIRFDYPVHCGFRNAQNVLCIGTSQGLWYYPKGKLDHAEGVQILKSFQIANALTDREGNLWLASINKGLVLIKSLWIEQLFESNVNKLLELDQQLYLYRFDTLINSDLHSPSFHIAEFFKKSPSSTLDLSIQTGTLKDADWNERDSTLWIAHAEGVHAFKNGQKTWDSQEHGFEQRSTCISLDGEQLYIGGPQGLYHWNLKTNQISRQQTPKLLASITDICILPNRGICIATNGQGIFYRASQQDSFVILSQKEGLPSNFVQSLIFEHGKLWAGTNKGLGICFWETQTWQYLNSKNGLPSNDIKSIAQHHGKTWVATLAGISLIDTAYWNLQAQTTPIPIVLNQISLEGAIQASNIENHYTLPPFQKSINILFDGLTFRNRPVYRYRLLGLSNTWQESHIEEIQFNTLAPGDYRLEVAAKLPGFEWGAAQEVLRLTVIAHFTQSNWFLIGLFFLGILSSVLIGLAFVRAIYRRSNTKLLIQSLRQKALRTQMNPHFLFNTMNSIQYLIATNKNKEARKYIGQLSTLLRQVLQQSEHEFISIEEEIKTLQLYLKIEEMRHGEHLSITFEVEENLPSHFKIPPMLIQPILENALVHGLSPKEDKGALICKIDTLDNQMLQITVLDDGIGEAASKKSQANNPALHSDKVSIGLNNITERIRTLNKIYKDYITFKKTDYLPNTAYPGMKVILTFNQAKLD